MLESYLKKPLGSPSLGLRSSRYGGGFGFKKNSTGDMDGSILDYTKSSFRNIKDEKNE
jgi:hypothetical protein